MQLIYSNFLNHKNEYMKTNLQLKTFVILTSNTLCDERYFTEIEEIAV